MFAATVSHRSSFLKKFTMATVFALGSLGATFAQAGVLTFTDTTVGGPTWNRPLTTTTLSGVGTNVAYDVTQFPVDQTGSYSVLSQSLVPAAWDNYLVLYANAFSATSPLANIVVLNDDLTVGSFGTAGFTLNLTAGINYFLVETGFSNTSAGSYRRPSSSSCGPTARASQSSILKLNWKIFSSAASNPVSSLALSWTSTSA